MTTKTNLIDIHGSSNPQIVEYILFWAAQETLYKWENIQGHKTSFSEKSIEITQCIFFDHNGIKVKIINRKICRKLPSI